MREKEIAPNFYSHPLVVPETAEHVLPPATRRGPYVRLTEEI